MNLNQLRKEKEQIQKNPESAGKLTDLGKQRNRNGEQ